MQNANQLTQEEKARLMRNAYQREWAKKNREKCRQAQIRHYAKKYDEMIDQMIDDFANDYDLERGDSNE